MRLSILSSFLLSGFFWIACNNEQKPLPENNDFSYIDSNTYQDDDDVQSLSKNMDAVNFICEKNHIELIGNLLIKSRTVNQNDNIATSEIRMLVLNKPLTLDCDNNQQVVISEVAIHTENDINNLLGSSVIAIGDIKYNSKTDYKGSLIADANIVRIEALKGSGISNF